MTREERQETLRKIGEIHADEIIDLVRRGILDRRTIAIILETAAIEFSIFEQQSRINDMIADKLGVNNEQD